MLDIGWTEIAVIVVVAIVVIGPKDLPLVLKTVGGWIRKARLLTREFQGHVDDMIREAELEDVRRQALEIKNMNLARQVEKTVDPTGSLRNALDPEADAKKASGAKDAQPAQLPPSTEAPAEPADGRPAEPARAPEPPKAEPARTAEPASSYSSEQAEPEKRT